MTPNKKGAARQGKSPQPTTALDDTRMAVSMREAAGYLSVSERTIFSMCNRGELRSVKLGRCRRIPMDAILELLGGGV